MTIEFPIPVRTKYCVIYLRVSSRKQTIDGAGLSSQERSCREYAERNGYEVIEVFSDVISGRYTERPGMNALLAFLRKAKNAEYVVVVDDISRFARDVSTHSALPDRILSSGAKIESPNVKFGEDAGGRFIETIMAAIAEHDRLKNAEQSHRRTIARLQNGFWVFHAPIGYRYEKAPGGGKRLVPDEPLASIVKEALEGFAAGRFQTVSEVKRFLETKTAFPKGYYGSEVHFDKVKRILTNVLYAGYLQFPKWEIPLMRAQHEPLISFATLEIIRERLQERSVAPARKDINRDFPLRGFLICECCGHPLTACWSTSRSGKKYPYYLCGYRGCAAKGKAIARDKLEEQFEEQLRGLVPDQTTYDLARDLFRQAWDERAAFASSEAKQLRAKARQIDRDIDEYLKRLVQTENPKIISTYETRIEELQREKAQAEDAASRIGNPEHSFDTMFEHATRFLANPYDIWKKVSLRSRELCFGWSSAVRFRSA